MIFKELIIKYDWNNIKENLLKLYPDEIKNINGYEFVFNDLLTKRVKKSDTTINISHIDDEEFDEHYYDVHGTDGTKNEFNPDIEQKLGLDFCSHTDWISFKISEELLKEMSELDIICHCLWELTFMGFNDKEIRKEKYKIRKTVKDIKSGKAKLIPLEDLFKEELKSAKSEV